jgi:hypothetical protein
LQRAWVLRDERGLFRSWLARTERFPDALKINILNHFIPVLRANTLELVSSAERGMGPHVFLFFLTRAVDALSSILYALNDIFDPADRRAEQKVWPQLKKVPVNFTERLNLILEGPFDVSTRRERAHQFAFLVDEVLSLTKDPI